MSLLSKITHYPVRFYTLIDSVESMTNSTIGEFFEKLQSEHFHSKGNIKCPFHSESVYEHLIRCADECVSLANEYGVSEAEAYFTGLFHDVGKPATRKVEKNRISFKGHSIVSAGLMENFYSEHFLTDFGISRERWAEMSYVVSMHMCDREATVGLSMDSFRLLPETSRKLMAILRIADHKARTSNLSSPDPLETQGEFTKNILTPLSVAEFCNSHSLSNGVLVQIHGNSNAGKTTLARALSTHGDVVVSRDDVMVQTIRRSEKINRPYGEYTTEEYTYAYDVYNKQKAVFASQINSQMKETISRALTDGKVVFVDSMAISFMYSAQSIVPEMNALKISLWIGRGDVSTADRHLSLGSQKKVSLPNTMWNPYCEFDWHAIVPVHESGNFNSTIRPHLGFGLSWNSPLGFVQAVLNEARVYNSQIPRLPSIDETRALSLTQLVQFLNEKKCLFEFFKYHHYIAQKVFEGDDELVLMIKYIDGINNLWQPLWARQARGMVVYLNTSTNEVKMLKAGPARGVELLTEAHLSSQIFETQDYTNSDDSHLDTVQRALNRQLAIPEARINGVLTSKVDGSLLLVSVYRKDSFEACLVRKIADATAFTFENDEFFGVISTQGTLFIGGGMKEYFLTAIYNMLTGNELSSRDKPERIWSEIRESFFNWFESKISVSHNTTYAFEMVCKNRTDYNGFTHNELAISYDESFIQFLGFLKFENCEFVPHFLTSHHFLEPMVIPVETSADLVAVIRNWNEMVFDRISLIRFCEMYSVTVPKHIDAEGFVLYTPTATGYNYSKTKLPIYYKLHKIRSSNIPDILTYPTSVDRYFPDAGRIKRFYANGKTQMEDLYKRGVQHLVDLANSNRTFGLSDKVLANRATPEKFVKILLNNKQCASEVYTEIRTIVDEIFGSSGKKITESFLRGLFMNGVSTEYVDELFKLYE